MAIKEKEYCLAVDNFKRPKVYEHEQAIAILLTRLILLNPGADPLHPDMGVGITNYRFLLGRVDDLRQRVQDQVQTYLQCFSSPKVTIEVTENKLCNIKIEIDDTMYVYDSSEAPVPITLDSVR